MLQPIPWLSRSDELVASARAANAHYTKAQILEGGKIMKKDHVMLKANGRSAKSDRVKNVRLIERQPKVLLLLSPATFVSDLWTSQGTPNRPITPRAFGAAPAISMV